ncbi:MAG TPA: molybdenum cofactor guanylyltransferase, partial [Gemmatimonadaceae bacterium]|nr:molybdenum cofactor guanylyltransferase [Gemmatimonadaceae bacterium]
MTGLPRRCGVLLAGGASTRFGGAPKGLAALGDRRVADGPLRALQASCGEVVIAANDDAAPTWFPEFRIVIDSEAGRGALGALETALHASDAATIIVCAWDMPFVTSALLDELAEAVEAGASCVVPVHPGGRHEPLCAAYGRQCAAATTALLKRG